MYKEATIDEIKNEFKDEKMLLIVSRQQYNMNEINDTINKFKSVFNNVTVKKCRICDFDDNTTNSYIDIIYDIETANDVIRIAYEPEDHEILFKVIKQRSKSQKDARFKHNECYVLK